MTVWYAGRNSFCPAYQTVICSCRQPQTYVKPEAAITVFELLMMKSVSLETC